MEHVGSILGAVHGGAAGLIVALGLGIKLAGSGFATVMDARTRRISMLRDPPSAILQEGPEN